MRKTICPIILVVFCNSLSAQDGIDSLQNLLIQAKNDTTRVELMNQIAASYELLKPDSGYWYAADAMVVIRKIDYMKGDADATRSLGVSLGFLGDFSRALEYSLDALKKSETLSDGELIARSLNSVGLVYDSQGDIQLGLEYYFKAKLIGEQLRLDDLLTRVLINIGK